LFTPCTTVERLLADAEPANREGAVIHTDVRDVNGTQMYD
jgi:hypothetical protein